uniref:hypothetical protein n=1 Tax=Streptomyces shenzhenensis TaxID=943815 RepID=UPI003558DEFE
PAPSRAASTARTRSGHLPEPIPGPAAALAFHHGRARPRVARQTALSSAAMHASARAPRADAAFQGGTAPTRPDDRHEESQ